MNLKKGSVLYCQDPPSYQSRRNSKRFLLFFKLLFFIFFLGSSIFFLIFIKNIDSVVQERFSGKRWTIPARVYARPLELFSGQRLSKGDFISELKDLGYRFTDKVNGPGDFFTEKNLVILNTRGFKFYEGVEESQLIYIYFSEKNIDKILDIQGVSLPLIRLEPLLIGSLYPENLEDRILLDIKTIPSLVTDTLVAVEDRDFYNHMGISLRSIARAIWINFSNGSIRQGGSTLTQQLVKNFYLTNEQSFSRKLVEVIMALLLESHYSKKEILEAYLNEVFIAQDGIRAIHGFGLASQFFFRKPLAELELEQIALLVGMVKGPSAYNPRRHPERALSRRNLVLDSLYSQGIVSKEKWVSSKKKSLGVTQYRSTASNPFPAFLDLVKRQLYDEYTKEDLTNEGLHIFTSLDPILQKKSEEAMAEAFSRSAWRKGSEKTEAAMVVINHKTGEVQAIIGGRQPKFSGFNRALDAVRPIGSLIKPVVYLTALEKSGKYNLLTPILDEALSIENSNGEIWNPKNYDKEYHGKVFLYEAMTKSYNLATVRLGLELGIDEVLNTLHRLGVRRNFPRYPSMLLGSEALTPMEVATMYQTIANGGFNLPLRGIRSVLTMEAEHVKRYSPHMEQRFDPGVIYLIENLMQHVMREGTGKFFYNIFKNKAFIVAGKTGTSNDSRDSWFAGFSEDLLSVVWIGRDDNGETPYTGSTGAMRIWAYFMKNALPLSLKTAVPDNIIEIWVNLITGERFPSSCGEAVKIPYIKKNAPTVNSICSMIGSHNIPSKDRHILDWIIGFLR